MYNASRPLTWRDEINLAWYRMLARGAKQLARALDWARPIREYLIWTPPLSLLAGMVVGLVIRTLLAH